MKNLRWKKATKKQDVKDALNFYKALYGKDLRTVNEIQGSKSEPVRDKSGNVDSDSDSTKSRQPTRNTRGVRQE